MFDAVLNLLAQAVFGRVHAPGENALLDHRVRRRLYQLIHRKPGMHASEICRESGEPWGTVHYHLALLRNSKLVTSLEAGRERHFFPPDVDPQRARLLSLLNQGRRQEIAGFIRDNPGIRQVDICDAMAVSRKTFRSSIRPLVEEGLIEERRGLQSNRYFPQVGLFTAFDEPPQAERVAPEPGGYV